MKIVQFNQGSKYDRDVLGVTGAHLCEMARLNISTLPGFIITDITSNELEHEYEDKLRMEIEKLEQVTDKSFELSIQPNYNRHPLLLSATLSTNNTDSHQQLYGEHYITNLGFNDVSAEQLTMLTTQPHWVYEQYLDFLIQFGTLIQRFDKQQYCELLQTKLAQRGVKSVSALCACDLVELVNDFKSVGFVPDSPFEQLLLVIQSVQQHQHQHISDNNINSNNNNNQVSLIIQVMTYSDKNEHCGYGKLHSRNPDTGMKPMCGEYYTQASVHMSMLNTLLSTATTVVMSQSHRGDIMRDRSKQENAYGRSIDEWCFRTTHPHLCMDLAKYSTLLEQSYKDMVTLHFIVEDSILYITSVHSSDRTVCAMVTSVISMVTEHILNEKEALLRIDPRALSYYEHPTIDTSMAVYNILNCSFSELIADPSNVYARNRIIAHGTAVADGAVSGRVALNIDEVKHFKEVGERCILVQYAATTTSTIATATSLCAGSDGSSRKSSSSENTSSDKLNNEGNGKLANDTIEADGMLILHGASIPPHATAHTLQNSDISTSIVTNVHNLHIDTDKHTLNNMNDIVCLHTGDIITIDGSTGLVYRDAIPIIKAGQDVRYQRVLEWIYKYGGDAINESMSIEEKLKVVQSVIRNSGEIDFDPESYKIIPLNTNSADGCYGNNSRNCSDATKEISPCQIW